LLDRSLFSAAKEHFAALVAGADDALRLFSEAMIALADNDPKAAQEKLAQGLSRKSSNPALSALMQQVLDKLSKAGPTTASAAGMQSEVSLGVYRQYTVDSV